MDSTITSFLDDCDAILQALDLAGVGVWRWQVATEQLEWTRNLESIHCLPSGTFDGTIASFTQDIHPDDKETVWAAIRGALETGEGYEVRYRTYPAEGRDPIWIGAKGATVSLGGQTYLSGTCQDVTKEVQAEEELRKRLAHLAAITELGSFALGEQHFHTILEKSVEIAARMFNAPLTKILQFGDSADELQLKAGLGWKDGLVGNAFVGTDHASQAGYTLSVHEPVIVRDLRTEQRFTGPQLLLDHGVVSGMSVVIEGSGGRPFGVFGVHDTKLRDFDSLDASSLLSLANVVANAARHNEALARQKLLTREINHRANNLLQIVGIIGKQTFATHTDPKDAIASFQNRLKAISRTNSLITNSGWAPSRLRTVMEEVLQPYGRGILLNGPDILLPPQLCFDISLVLHELATNSLKYGSLGCEDGSVDVRWSLVREGQDAMRFDLKWTDPFTRPSSLKGTGFGRKLKTLLIEGKWNGTMNIEISDHYQFECSIPLTKDMVQERSPDA